MRERVRTVIYNCEHLKSIRHDYILQKYAKYRNAAAGEIARFSLRDEEIA